MVVNNYQRRILSSFSVYKVFVIALITFFLSCQQSTVADNRVTSVSEELSISESENTQETRNEQVELVEVGLSPLNIEKKVTVGDGLSRISIQNANIDAHIYAFDEGYSFLKYKDLYFPLEFNYTYDTDFESAVADIQLFQSEKHRCHYLFLPSYTEEFSTYHALSLENETAVDQGMHSLSAEEFEKSLGAKGEKAYLIFEKENTVFLTLHWGETKINFDEIYETDQTNTEKLEDAHLERIRTFLN